MTTDSNTNADPNHPLCSTLAGIIDAHPKLGLSGFYQPRLPKPFTPDDAIEHAAAFAACVEFLRVFYQVAPPATTPGRAAWSDQVRDAMRACARLHGLEGQIHHGLIIAAALHLGARERLMRDCLSIALDIDGAFVERAIDRWESMARGRPFRPRNAADEALDRRLGLLADSRTDRR